MIPKSKGRFACAFEEIMASLWSSYARSRCALYLSGISSSCNPDGTLTFKCGWIWKGIRCCNMARQLYHQLCAFKAWVSICGCCKFLFYVGIHCKIQLNGMCTDSVLITDLNSAVFSQMSLTSEPLCEDFHLHLQLTQKKSTLQFKALDQVLQTINRETGEKQALTYKCADIDRIIPTIMGVSKVSLGSLIPSSQWFSLYIYEVHTNYPQNCYHLLK